jgi:D-lactate dehydrogenase
VREGLHGLVGRVRIPGTALIIEDVCVPPARIAEGARDLQALLGEHGFLPGVAGHASAGNLHFMLTPDFAKQEDLERYEAFMAKLVELIVGKYDGSLKAEHGTGINMAPYVEREWGEKATELMWRVKRLADPDGVLAPGVVLNRDPGVHLRNLKTTPPIEQEAATCVECGFCEPVCPSRNLTTTPRQRIVLRREIARQPEGSPLRRALLEEYEYDSLDTCAADGSCQLACPVGIDTGKLVKELREEGHSPRAERAALAVAKRWHTVERAARAGLRLGGPLARRTKRGRGLPGAARAGVGGDPHPTKAGSVGRGSPPTPRSAAAVYVPSCTNRIFDGNPIEALVEVSARAGLPVWIPADVAGTCCGLPFGSKGYSKAHAQKANALVESLWRWSGEGELPIVIDAASCTQAVAEPGDGVLYEENVERLGALEILDSVAWAHDRLLSRLEIPEKVNAATAHPTCATRHMGLAPRLRSLTAALAEEVYVAPSATCCGFAGDRGLSHPELTASATRPQADELAGRRFDAHLSSNRTCEIGMSRATGAPYESVVCLLERLTRSG